MRQKNPKVLKFDKYHFEPLLFKGLPVITDEPLKTDYQHIYYTNGSALPGVEIKKRHACLRSGEWCFRNFKEHPIDVFTFLKYKISPQ